ncbi:GNAT family N-acetyltransferase [Grimontia sp. NTOU-MAR1]|uniref:GNAT family N-acetyltransferase n=1 Tax=Grimontia sp. NTOU-MAR1 TaxID=3111011 RepID=UPI002DBD1739|nr:GNAT family N-acetyltransferase [Grimontia sp. NTOU-MAR1]WRV97959.1 GNAT family N-acetyltransferase [Grimontia sp. NTOU-MAR1]
MTIIEIRPACGTDLTDIQSCAWKAYGKYVQRMDRDPAPMHADFESLIARGCVDVAIGDSLLVGYVVFYPERSHICLENIAVLPEYNRLGFGRCLIEHVERIAKDTGYETVVLYTNEAMTENLSMYPKMGYIEVERRREAGFNRVYFRKQV